MAIYGQDKVILRLDKVLSFMILELTGVSIIIVLQKFIRSNVCGKKFSNRGGLKALEKVP